MKPIRRPAAAIAVVITATTGLLVGSGLAAGAASAGTSFIGPLQHEKVVASTVPRSGPEAGDVNPYGVAVVPHSTGRLHAGNVLVSNFNNKANTQGTGSTIVQVSPGGHESVFATVPNLGRGCPGGVGLTTALVTLPSGWVIVGSLPTKKGKISGPGCLIVLDSHGAVRETFTGHGIDGPWDMTAVNLGRRTSELFVTNVLGGILGKADRHGGTVQRLTITTGPGLPRLLASTRIGSGFPARTDPNALVIGPTGDGFGLGGTLYVADTLDNRIAAIPDAAFRRSDDGRGRTVTRGGALNSELGLAIAPNGDILTVNGGNGNIVETTPFGRQIAVKTIDHNSGGGGNLFGLAVKPRADAVYFVDDFGSDNNLQLFH
jgi:hypothetical protein